MLESERISIEVWKVRMKQIKNIMSNSGFPPPNQCKGCWDCQGRKSEGESKGYACPTAVLPITRLQMTALTAIGRQCTSQYRVVPFLQIVSQNLHRSAMGTLKNCVEMVFCVSLYGSFPSSYGAEGCENCNENGIG